MRGGLDGMRLSWIQTGLHLHRITRSLRAPLQQKQGALQGETDAHLRARIVQVMFSRNRLEVARDFRRVLSKWNRLLAPRGGLPVKIETDPRQPRSFSRRDFLRVQTAWRQQQSFS